MSIKDKTSQRFDVDSLTHANSHQVILKNIKPNHFFRFVHHDHDQPKKTPPETSPCRFSVGCTSRVADIDLEPYGMLYSYFAGNIPTMNPTLKICPRAALASSLFLMITIIVDCSRSSYLFKLGVYIQLSHIFSISGMISISPWLFEATFDLPSSPWQALRLVQLTGHV